MSRTLTVCGALLLASAVTYCAWPAQAAPQSTAPRAKWEYQVLTATKIEERGGGQSNALVAGLNALGEDGWELVAIEPGHVPAPVRAARYVFKRPK